jgi:UDP-glucose-4-epimerase GalE
MIKKNKPFNVLITGCNGYIGKILCKYIKSSFNDSFIIGVDVVKDVNNIYVDAMYTNGAGDRKILENFKTHDIDFVFHLGAVASVPDSFLRPSHYYHNNVSQTIDLINNLNEIEWRGKLVFASSAGVYYQSNDLYRENHLLGPGHPYGRSKLMAEAIIEDISRLSHIDTTVFRFFNVVGACGEVGDHLDSGHVLQKLCKAAFNNSEFEMYGTNLNTIDGSCVRDFIDVLDICEAFIRATDYNKSDVYKVYNLGTSEGTSVKQLIHMFEEVTGKKINAVECPQRKGDPIFLVADGSAFAKDAEFKYQTDLKHSIKTAWDHYQQSVEK